MRTGRAVRTPTPLNSTTFRIELELNSVLFVIGFDKMDVLNRISTIAIEQEPIFNLITYNE
jgi:hypothetical protein